MSGVGCFFFGVGRVHFFFGLSRTWKNLKMLWVRGLAWAGDVGFLEGAVIGPAKTGFLRSMCVRLCSRPTPKQKSRRLRLPRKSLPARPPVLWGPPGAALPAHRAPQGANASPRPHPAAPRPLARRPRLRRKNRRTSAISC